MVKTNSRSSLRPAVLFFFIFPHRWRNAALYLEGEWGSTHSPISKHMDYKREERKRLEAPIKHTHSQIIKGYDSDIGGNSIQLEGGSNTLRRKGAEVWKERQRLKHYVCDMKQVISPLWLAEVLLPLSIIKEYMNILSYPQSSDSKKKSLKSLWVFSQIHRSAHPKRKLQKFSDTGYLVQTQDTRAMSHSWHSRFVPELKYWP